MCDAFARVMSVKPREPLESRAPAETSAPEELSASDLEVVAAFAPPLLRLGPINLMLQIVSCVAVYCAALTLGVALNSGVPAFLASCLGVVGVALSLKRALGQLLRRARSERREGDHSLGVLLLLLPVGVLCAAAMALWAFILCVGNPAD